MWSRFMSIQENTVFGEDRRHEPGGLGRTGTVAQIGVIEMISPLDWDGRPTWVPLSQRLMLIHPCVPSVFVTRLLPVCFPSDHHLAPLLCKT